MCSGDKNGCIPIKYFKEIRNIQKGEQVEFIRHSPEKSLSPSAQNFVPIALTGIIPTNNIIPFGQEKQTSINDPA